MTKDTENKAAATEQPNQPKPETTTTEQPTNQPDTKLAAKAEKLVDCAVLLDCRYGKNGDIIKLSAEEAKAAYADGMVDTHPNAIKALKKAK